MELVGIEDLLVESCIPEGQRTALFDPGRGGLGGGYVDLVLTAGGDGRAELAHHILFGQDIDETVVILDGDKIPAGRIHTLLEDVGHLTEVGAEGRQHGGLIGFAGASGSGIGRGKRPVGQRDGGGTVELGVDRMQVLHAGDLLSEVDDLGLHAVVGGTVLSGQGAVLGAVGVQEGLGLLPQVGALLAQIVDREHRITFSPLWGLSYCWLPLCGRMGKKTQPKAVRAAGVLCSMASPRIFCFFIALGYHF